MHSFNDKTDLTPSGTYKVQTTEKELLIQCLSGTTVLSIPILVNTLREIGFVITYPLPKLVKDIQEFLQSLDIEDSKVSKLGNVTTIGVFLKHKTCEVTLAPTDSRLNVDIHVDTPENSLKWQTKFSGHVESLDEFKLIWSRIL